MTSPRLWLLTSVIVMTRGATLSPWGRKAAWWLGGERANGTLSVRTTEGVLEKNALLSGFLLNGLIQLLNYPKKIKISYVVKALFQLPAEVHVILHFTVTSNHVTFTYCTHNNKKKLLSVGKYFSKYKDKHLPLVGVRVTLTLLGL